MTTTTRRRVRIAAVCLLIAAFEVFLERGLLDRSWAHTMWITIVQIATVTAILRRFTSTGDTPASPGRSSSTQPGKRQ